MDHRLRTLLPIPLVRLARFLRHFSYRLFDAAGSLVFRLFPKKPARGGPVRAILLIRIDRIGDLVLTTPALHAVRTAFPGARIDLLLSAYTKDLLAASTDFDRLLIEGRDRIKGEYDLAIAFLPGIRANFRAFQSRAGMRIGYRGAGGSFFLTHPVTDDRARRLRHEVESALELARLAGCSGDDTRLRVPLCAEGESFAEDFLRAHGLIGKTPLVAIHPGARQRSIRWKSERFAAVANRLAEEREASIIIIGSAHEEALTKEVASLLRRPPVLALGLRLDALASLLKRCDLFIGNSTGPMHIAAACGVPVVAVFGARHPLDSAAAWGPWRTRARIVSAQMHCPRCHPGDCRRYDCMAAVTAEAVFFAAGALLAETRTP